jgi:NADP-dependent 3-hydroxy acid dehydrogenase YdfG
LAGRTTNGLQPVAEEISTSGGAVEVAQVDLFNARSVSEHLHRIVVKHGTLDVSLNLAFLGIQGATRLCNLTGEQFDAATFTRVRSNFVTMAAAASVMAFQGQGIILASAAPARAVPLGTLAGEAVGSAAIEALCQQLRIDVGTYGVRIAYLADFSASEEDLVEHLVGVLQADTTTIPTLGETPGGPGIRIGSSRGEAPASLATS